MSFACLFAPCFAVQAIMRDQSGELLLRHATPIAVLEGPDSMMRVVACNEQALDCGAYVGMSKTQAEQLRSLVLRERSQEHETWAQDALLDCASRFSPRVESTANGIVTLDVAGLEHLMGDVQNIATALWECAQAMHFAVNVAVAANPDAALIAAKGIPGTTIIPEGQEADYLAPLPVEALSPVPEQAEIFESWGIRTCGELGRLPDVPLTERLGQDGLRLQQLATGKISRTLVPWETPSAFAASIELEEAVELLESLLFVINRLLEEIMYELAAHSLFVTEVRLALMLEKRLDRDLNQIAQPQSHSKDLEVYERAIKLPVPTEDRKTLLQLVQLDLEAHPPNGCVKKVKVTIVPAKPRFTQGNLFVRSAPEAEKTELVQAKLRAIVGSADYLGRNTVGSPLLVDSPCPDSFTVVPFAGADARRAGQLVHQQEEDLLRIFRPPKAADVLVYKGKPKRLSFTGVSSEIRQASGPWRCSGNWWQERFEHEIWDVELEAPEGAVCYRIYRDLRAQAWFARGKFD